MSQNRDEAERLMKHEFTSFEAINDRLTAALDAAESRGRNAGIDACIAKLNSWIEHHARASGILELARNDLVRLSETLLSNPATPEGEVVKCEHEWCRELDRIKCLNCGENCEHPRQGYLGGSPPTTCLDCGARHDGKSWVSK